MRYSTKSKTAKFVCEELGFIFDIGFVECAKTKNGIYISFTCGKPHEIWALYQAIINADKKFVFKVAPSLQRTIDSRL